MDCLRARCILLAALAFGGGCLDPLVSDDVPARDLARPAGWEPPFLYDDLGVAARVDAHDGVERQVWPVGAFAEGNAVSYWDFGPAPDFAAPMYVFKRRMGEGSQPVMIDDARTHPNVIDVIPGDANYSPFWAVYDVYVTSEWTASHRVTSVEELGQAERAGLVEPPVRTGLFVNCPVVHPDVRVMIPERVAGEVVGFMPKMPVAFYYRGHEGTFFDLSGTSGPDPLIDPTQGLGIEATDVYVLHRPGEPPLSEPQRHVDITGDGDVLDTNDVFQFAVANPAQTPLRRIVEVTIRDTDTCMTSGLGARQRQAIDEIGGAGTSSDWNDAEILFDVVDGQLVAKTECVVAWRDTGLRMNYGMLGAEY